MKKEHLILIGALAVILSAILFFSKDEKRDLSLGGFNPITTVASSSHVLVGITTETGYGTAGKVTQLTTTTTFPGYRTYFAVVNTDSNYVCLNLSPVPPIDCQGIYLAPFGGSFEMSEEETGVVYQGTITAISNSGTSSVTYTETR